MAQPVLTLRIPEPMMRALQTAADVQGRSVGDAGREALAQWLDRIDPAEVLAQLRATQAEREAKLKELEAAIAAMPEWSNA